MPNRGPKAFQCFLEAIADDYDWIAEELEAITQDQVDHGHDNALDVSYESPSLIDIISGSKSFMVHNPLAYLNPNFVVCLLSYVFKCDVYT